MEVTWKKFKNSRYSVSNTGQVMNHKTGRLRKGTIYNKKYRGITLNIDGGKEFYLISTLVAMLFLGYKHDSRSIVIKHLNGDTLHDWANNLEVVTTRESNSTKTFKKKTSKYTGVHWDTRTSSWRACIGTKTDKKHLGFFKEEIDAHNAYQGALLNLKK